MTKDVEQVFRFLHEPVIKIGVPGRERIRDVHGSAYWGIAQTLLLAPGQHTVATYVSGAGIGGGPALVGGDGGSVLQGTLDILVMKH